jgi:hypothetical protein
MSQYMYSDHFEAMVYKKDTEQTRKGEEKGMWDECNIHSHKLRIPLQRIRVERVVILRGAPCQPAVRLGYCVKPQWDIVGERVGRGRTVGDGKEGRAGADKETIRVARPTSLPLAVSRA